MGSVIAWLVAILVQARSKVRTRGLSMGSGRILTSQRIMRLWRISGRVEGVDTPVVRVLGFLDRVRRRPQRGDMIDEMLYILSRM